MPKTAGMMVAMMPYQQACVSWVEMAMYKAMGIRQKTCARQSRPGSRETIFSGKWQPQRRPRCALQSLHNKYLTHGSDAACTLTDNKQVFVIAQTCDRHKMMPSLPHLLSIRTASENVLTNCIVYRVLKVLRTSLVCWSIWCVA